jgi:PAS domain S-box-containing protein
VNLSQELNDFFENGALPLHWVGPDGTILRANRAELELLGYSAEEYIGRNIAEFHADAPVIEDILRRLTAGETLRNYPARVRCKDGTLRDVLITSNVQWDAQQRFVHTRCFSVDVSDRKRVDELTAVTADYLEGLMEGFVAYDGNWRMTYMNAAGERLLGRDRRDVLGKTWHEAFPHAVGNPVDLMYQRVRRDRVPELMEYYYPHYGRWLEIAASPVSGGGVAVYFHDISDRVRAHRELEFQVSALTRLHELAVELGGLGKLDDMLQAILITVAGFHGTDKGILSLYDAQSGTLEVSASLGLDESALEKLPQLTPGENSAAAGRAFASGQRVVVEDTEKDERYADYRDAARAADFRAIHSTPIVNRVGMTLGVISVFFSAPRRPSRLETQLAEMCARYAADTVEATRAQDELREADRRKDEFLATLAHELRNPLAPIRNGLQLLSLAQPGSDAAEQARAMMERQTKHLVRLVDDLLEVARISTGKLDLRKEPVELAAVLGSAIEASRPLIESAGHALRIDLPPEVITLDADPVRLAQVMANLLNNAAKYTEPNGSIELGVRRAGAQVEISVRDNGIGIEPAMLARVFDLFMQSGDAPSRAQGGLGIGLTLARTLVELHGGTIEARSPGAGKGSEFTVRLPVLSSRAQPRKAQSPEQGQAQRVKARRVLVVDDNVDAAMSLGMLLTAMGHEVQVLHDGAAAVENACANRPDLLLLDLTMPGLDGLRVAQRLRADPRCAGMRIVAITGHGREDDFRRSREAGFDDHVVKPVAPERLSSLLAQ